MTLCSKPVRPTQWEQYESGSFSSLPDNVSQSSGMAFSATEPRTPCSMLAPLTLLGPREMATSRLPPPAFAASALAACTCDRHPRASFSLSCQLFFRHRLLFQGVF